jgi:histidine ammonia-lyase
MHRYKDACHVRLNDSAVSKMDRSLKILEAQLAKGHFIYGIPPIII